MATMTDNTTNDTAPELHQVGIAGLDEPIDPVALLPDLELMGHETPLDQWFAVAAVDYTLEGSGAPVDRFDVLAAAGIARRRFRAGDDPDQVNPHTVALSDLGALTDAVADAYGYDDRAAALRHLLPMMLAPHGDASFDVLLGWAPGTFAETLANLADHAS